MSDTSSKRTLRESLRVYGPAVALVLLGFVIAWQFIEPGPPRHIRLATGQATGTYHAMGKRLAELLAKQGIEVELVASSGAVHNLEKLRSADVDFAFTQGGVRAAKDGAPLQAIASLYYEPLWVFLKPGTDVELLSQLRGKKLAVGPEGSGTRAVALALLAENGIEGSAAGVQPLGGMAAADALLGGQADGVFLVGSAKGEAIQKLLRSDRAVVFDFVRAKAFSRRHRFLSEVLLPRGAIDPALDLPKKDVRLVAPTAQLVAVEDFHPALVDLILSVSAPLFRDGDVLQDQPEFPSLRYVDHPPSPIAERYFKNGRPFLYRFLPFNVAAFLDRMKILLLPLLTLLIPLVKMVPPIYRWRIRSRIYKWYESLAQIDASTDGTGLQRLQELDEEVAKVTVPASFADDLYHLKSHIHLVRERLNARADSA